MINVLSPKCKCLKLCILVLLIFIDVSILKPKLLIKLEGEVLSFLILEIMIYLDISLPMNTSGPVQKMDPLTNIQV